MGLFKKKPKIETLTIDGKTFLCHVCGGQNFSVREAQLNTALASLVDMDWANKSAKCYVCKHCRYIHWFLP